MDFDDIFIKSFLNDVQENEKKKISQSKEDRIISAEKQKKLLIIEKFLQKFVDLDVWVTHNEVYTKNFKVTETIEPQKFSFYYQDSSRPWYPGVSICFNHPATVEIAIPNKSEEGLIVMKVGTTHPNSYLLEQNFSSYESACEALGRFLSKSTHTIKQDPTKYLKDVEQKKQINPERIENISSDDSLNILHQRHIHEVAVLKENKTSPLSKIGAIFQGNKDDDDDD